MSLDPAGELIYLVARNTTTTTNDTASRPPVYKAIGITLAVCSGLFIGVSFVLKKIGLLKANVKYNEEAGEGYGYLKNFWWWTGMTLMIIGEICNFVAYAFVDAILVTPMGSLSVVVTAILSAIFLKERLSFVGKVGCFQCIVGSIVIAVNSPEQSSVATIQDMQGFVISPGFLSYAGVIIVGCVFIALWAGPRYGKKNMLVYLSVCSLIGGLSVVATQGLGAAIVTQISGTPQFNQWFLYVLLVFVIATLVTEIIYLNKALNLFNAALVTPTYYVYFTSSTIVASAILFRGFKGSVIQIITIILGFFTICSGVVLLQLSKSSKDVPDAAVFNGELDQMRTVAEQEESEYEPKGDAIRGTAALLRSVSKARQQRERQEAKRFQEERLEPIGEDEQIEWDGLRRRKTLKSQSSTSIRRQRTVHPPLGLTRMPDDVSESEHQLDEGSEGAGILGGIRAKARTVIQPKRSASSLVSRNTEANKDPGVATKHSTFPMANIGQRNVSGSTDASGGDLSQQRRHLSSDMTYDVPADLKRNTAIGLSSLGRQDTSYKSPAIGVSWAPDIGRNTTVASASTDRNLLSPEPPPPPAHGGSGDAGPARRQFSFQNVFSRRRSDSADDRPTSRGSNSTSGSILSSIRRSAVGGAGGANTEEERLGLVSGDSHAQALAYQYARPPNTPTIHEPDEYVEYESPVEDLDEEDDFEKRESYGGVLEGGDRAYLATGWRPPRGSSAPGGRVEGEPPAYDDGFLDEYRASGSSAGLSRLRSRDEDGSEGRGGGGRSPGAFM